MADGDLCAKKYLLFRSPLWKMSGCGSRHPRNVHTYFLCILCILFFLVEPLDKIKVNLGLIFLCILFVLDSIVASLLQGEQS